MDKVLHKGWSLNFAIHYFIEFNDLSFIFFFPQTNPRDTQFLKDLKFSFKFLLFFIFSLQDNPFITHSVAGLIKLKTAKLIKASNNSGFAFPC